MPSRKSGVGVTSWVGKGVRVAVGGNQITVGVMVGTGVFVWVGVGEICFRRRLTGSQENQDHQQIAPPLGRHMKFAARKTSVSFLGK